MRKLLWLAILAVASGCGRTVTSWSDPPLVTVEHPEQAAGAAPANTSDESSEGGICVALATAEAEPNATELQLEYACGIYSAERKWSSDYVAGGERCGTTFDLNTFSLRLKGAAAARYSAVVRCGYIRYDNGTFVGGRVAVEARDGQWCHEPALGLIQLADRMLLTDVSFSIESKDAALPARPLAVAFSTFAGWTPPVPAEGQLCLYVAHREPGSSTCRMVAPASDCTCPCGDAWEDFMVAVQISFAKH
jgi:hypothetical protein